jgi:Zn-dependent peptidase ImmA (M78 family)
VIGVNASHPSARRRFTIAHELGHVLLLAHDDLHVDGKLMLRDATSSQGNDRREIEANAFAAELLMPVEMLRHEIVLRGGIDLDDDRDVGGLARIFGVSVQALLIRLSDRAFVVTGTNFA